MHPTPPQLTVRGDWHIPHPLSPRWGETDTPHTPSAHGEGGLTHPTPPHHAWREIEKFNLFYSDFHILNTTLLKIYDFKYKKILIFNQYLLPTFFGLSSSREQDPHQAALHPTLAGVSFLASLNFNVFFIWTNTFQILNERIKNSKFRSLSIRIHSN